MAIMGNKAFSKSLHELFISIDFCLKQNLTYPSILLVCSGIDALSFVHYPNKKTVDAFTLWTEKWILPYPEIECNAIDLYAARSGWLHRMGTGANLIERNKAKSISLCIGSGEFDILKKLMEQVKKETNIDCGVVKLEALAESFKNGTQKFLEFAKTDKELRVRMEEYLNKETPCILQA